MVTTAVNINADFNVTAQNLRTAINQDADTGVSAQGGANVLSILALASGPDGAGIGLSASGSEPIISSSNLVPQSAIQSVIGQRVSNLRGVGTFWYDGQVCSNNPYPKAWKFRVRRAVKGWSNDTCWYPNRAVITLGDGLGNTIKAMNGAHILMQCLTDKSWGRALPMDGTIFDLPTWIAAANWMYNEGFGLCLSWANDTDIDDFIQTIINHIGGMLYVDRSTGLLVLKLIRADYDPNQIPVFDYNSGLMSIAAEDASSQTLAYSEIIVQWIDPVTGDNRQTRAQNLASSQANLSLASNTVQYPGVPNVDIAGRIAARDLAAQATGLKRYTVTLDRRGRKITPGCVFRINVPSRNINNIILRAGKVTEGPGTNNSITVVGVQDVYNIGATSYIGSSVSTWVPPDTGIQAPTVRRWREAAYRDLVRTLTAANLATIAVDSGMILTAAKQPTSLSTDYVLETAGSGEDYQSWGAKPWTPTGQLAFAIGRYTTQIVLQPGANNLSAVTTLGGIAWIDDECVRVDALDMVNGYVTVARGCLDTVPVTHLTDARMWFQDFGIVGTDGREYTIGEVVKIKLLTRTNTQMLALDDAPEDDLTISGRQGRPYPPGNLQVNGVPFASATSVSGQVVLTWAHRDRITQADHILSHTDGSTGPEPGTTYNVRIYSDTALTHLIRSTTGITGAGWTYTYAMMDADGPITPITVLLESERDGILSLQRYIWTFAHLDLGFGRGFNFNFNRNA